MIRREPAAPQPPWPGNLLGIALPPPVTGLRLGEAMMACARANGPRERMVRWFFAVSNWDHASDEDRKELRLLKARMERGLREKLASGELVLRGIDIRNGNTRTVDPHWCNIAHLDPVSDTAYDGTSGGLREVRVYAGKDSPERAIATAPSPRVGTSKGASPTTIAAAAAIATVIYREGIDWKSARQLAGRACELAQELGEPAADTMNPESSSIREMAMATLRMINRADAAPEKPQAVQTRPKPPIR